LLQENARETREKVKLLLQLADTLVEKVTLLHFCDNYIHIEEMGFFLLN
jgi:hypothetical protein